MVIYGLCDPINVLIAQSLADNLRQYLTLIIVWLMVRKLI